MYIIYIPYIYICTMRLKLYTFVDHLNLSDCRGLTSNPRRTARRMDRTEDCKVTIYLLSKMKSWGRAPDRCDDQCCVSIRNSKPAAVCTCHTKAQEHHDDLRLRRSYLRRKIQPTLRFYAKSRKIMRSILSEKKGESVRACRSFSGHVNRFRADMHVLQFVQTHLVASATLWYWTAVGGIAGYGEITYGDRRSNEDECLPEWADREIARWQESERRSKEERGRPDRSSSKIKRCARIRTNPVR